MGTKKEHQRPYSALAKDINYEANFAIRRTSADAVSVALG